MAAARWRGRGIALSSWVFSAFAGDCALFLLAGEFVFFSRLSQFSSLSLVLLCWFFAGDFFFFFFFCRRDPFDFRCGFLFAPLYSGVFLLPLPQGAFFFLLLLYSPLLWISSCSSWLWISSSSSSWMEIYFDKVLVLFARSTSFSSSLLYQNS